MLAERTLAYTLALVPHAVAAAIAMGAGLLALTTRKGATVHRWGGRWYWRVIAVVAVTGALLMTLGSYSTRLLVLLALTGHGTWSGVRVLRRRRPDLIANDRATRSDWGVALAALVVSIAAMALATAELTGRDTIAIWSTAPLLGAYATYDVVRFRRPAAWPMRPRLWLGEHIVKMTGAYFGAVSAFSGNVFTFIPMPWRIVAPNVIGVLVTGWFLARMRRRTMARTDTVTSTRQAAPRAA